MDWHQKRAAPCGWRCDLRRCFQCLNMVQSIIQNLPADTRMSWSIDIISCITDRFVELTATEKRIAQFILDDVAAAAEDEDMPGEGIIFQRVLDLRGQAVEATTHIRNASNDPDSGAGR